MRSREEIIKEPETVKGSSIETNEGSGSKERPRKESKSQNEANDTSSSSTRENSQCETDDGKNATFVVLQKNTRSLNSSEKIEKLIRELPDSRWDVLFAF